MQPHNTYSADCIAQSVFFFATPFTIFVVFYLSPTQPLLRSGVKKQVIIFPPRYRSFLEFLSRKYLRYFFIRRHPSNDAHPDYELPAVVDLFCYDGRINSKSQDGGIRAPAPRIVMVGIGGQHCTTEATGVALC